MVDFVDEKPTESHGSLSPETLAELDRTSSSPAPASITKKRRGRVARSTVVRRRASPQGGPKVPIIQPRPDGGSLTPDQANFVQLTTHPQSPHFLNPQAAHAEAYPLDPRAGTPARVERLLAKPAVGRTLKDLLDTPETRAKIQVGLDTILDDVEHTQFRPKEWTDALRAWAELTGNKSAEKVALIPIGPEERAQRYQEIAEKIKEAERPEGSAEVIP